MVHNHLQTLCLDISQFWREWSLRMLALKVLFKGLGIWHLCLIKERMGALYARKNIQTKRWLLSPFLELLLPTLITPMLSCFILITHSSFIHIFSICLYVELSHHALAGAPCN